MILRRILVIETGNETIHNTAGDYDDIYMNDRINDDTNRHKDDNNSSMVIVLIIIMTIIIITAIIIIIIIC